MSCYIILCWVKHYSPPHSSTLQSVSVFPTLEEIGPILFLYFPTPNSGWHQMSEKSLFFERWETMTGRPVLCHVRVHPQFQLCVLVNHKAFQLKYFLEKPRNGTFKTHQGKIWEGERCGVTWVLLFSGKDGRICEWWIFFSWIDLKMRQKCEICYKALNICFFFFLELLCCVFA